MMKTPRARNNAHLDFIRGLPCLTCGNDIQTEAAHIRVGARHLGKRQTGMGEKPSDFWTIPLCGPCHRTQHHIGEDKFWTLYGFRNPLVVALALWAHTGQQEVGEMIVRAGHD